MNSYKISNPTILSRISREELHNLFSGYGWVPYYVEGDDVDLVHQQMAYQLEKVVLHIKEIQFNAREKGNIEYRFPMIILRTPKGWTGPKFIDGKKIEGSISLLLLMLFKITSTIYNLGNFRSHQVPLAVDSLHPQNLCLLEEWLRSYKPDELFDKVGKLAPEIIEFIPEVHRRMSSNLSANGGVLLKDLILPDFTKYAIVITKRGVASVGNCHALGPYLRDVIEKNKGERNFRIFAPDETVSNRLENVFETTNRQWSAPIIPTDESLASNGAVLDSILSEHLCQGWMEGMKIY